MTREEVWVRFMAGVVVVSDNNVIDAAGTAQWVDAAVAEWEKRFPPPEVARPWHARSVHREHCADAGCKYGDADCPVACTHEGIGLPGCPTCDVRTASEGGPRPDPPPPRCDPSCVLTACPDRGKTERAPCDGDLCAGCASGLHGDPAEIEACGCACHGGGR